MRSPKTRQRTKEGAGFTLIELLIVVVLLGVLMGAVVFSLNPVSDERGLTNLAQRLAQRIELARDRAIQNNQEWGLHVQADGYGFVAFDDTAQRWVPQRQKPFQPDEAPSPLTFAITVEEGGFADIDPGVFMDTTPGAAGASGGDQDKNLPDVVFFSSGEASQFYIDLESSGGGQSVRLSTDGFRPVRVESADAFAAEVQ